MGSYGSSSGGKLPTIRSNRLRSRSRIPTSPRILRIRQTHSPRSLQILRSLQSPRNLQSLRSLYNRHLLRILHSHRRLRILYSHHLRNHHLRNHRLRNRHHP